MSKNFLSKGAYNPTAASSRQVSSWVLVFLEKELGWTVRSAGSILTSLNFASQGKEAAVSLMALWHMEMYPPSFQSRAW